MILLKELVKVVIPFGIVFLFLYIFRDLAYAGLTLIVDVSPLFFLLAVVLYSSSWILKGIKWEWLLPDNDISIAKLASLILLGNFISLVLPAKSGDIARLRVKEYLSSSQDQNVLSQHSNHEGVEIDNDTSTILATVLMDRIWDLLGILFAGLVLLSLFDFNEINRSILVLALVVLLIGLVTIYVIIPHFSETILKIIPDRLTPFFRKLLLGLSFLNNSQFFQMSLLSIGIWLLEGVIMHVLVLGLGLTVPLWALIMAVLVANLTKIFPITPGGFVIYEATIGYVISSMTTISLELSIGLGILDSLFKNGYTLMVGFFSYLIEFDILRLDLR